MGARPIALSVRFRGRGWQWPFRVGDSLTVYRDGDGTLLAELPATLIIELVALHLEGAALQAQMATHLGRTLTTLPPEDETTSTPRLRAQHGRKLRGR